MKPRAPVQLALFGAQYVHLGHRGVCVMCGVLLAVAGLYDDCSSCRGFVEPVPPWMVLGGAVLEAPVIEAREAA